VSATSLPQWLPDHWREWPDHIIVLGDEHYARYTAWAPDRELNPQYDGVPDVDRYGMMIAHMTLEGRLCMSAITFDGPVQRELDRERRRPMWQVHSLIRGHEHLEPSLLCRACGDHGWIREGKWVRA